MKSKALKKKHINENGRLVISHRELSDQGWDSIIAIMNYTNVEKKVITSFRSRKVNVEPLVTMDTQAVCNIGLSMVS